MKRVAFTLIELLVVVAIIALLMAILLPSLKLARTQTRDVICRQRIGEIVRGHLYYAQEWRDMLPGNSWQTTKDFNPDFVVSRGRRIKTWFNRILPMEPVL